MELMSRRVRRTLRTCASILLGNLILAFAIAAFVLPQGIMMGGATGIGLLLNHFLNADVADIVLILNLAALLLGWITLGKAFVAATIASSILYPCLLNLAQKIPGIDSLTNDPLLASILGGGLIGVAIGAVMRVGASTGGTDVLNLVLHKWLHLPVSVFVYLTDILILGGQAFFSKPEQILYGVVLLVVETVVLNQVMLLGQSQIQLFVVSTHFHGIRQKLLAELQAGVTMVLIETGCAGEQQEGVLCVIPPRKLFAAKELIHAIDPSAFITVTQIKEVRGQGFTLERQFQTITSQTSGGADLRQPPDART